METFQVFQNTKSWILDRHARELQFRGYGSFLTANKATPIFLRTFQIVSKQEFLLRPLVFEKSGKFEAPVERRNKEIPTNSHQMVEYDRVWAQTDGILYRNGFYLHWQGLRVLNSHLGQKVQSIFSFSKNHQALETTLRDQKSFSFSLTNRPNPKLAIQSSSEVLIRNFHFS